MTQHHQQSSGSIDQQSYGSQGGQRQPQAMPTGEMSGQSTGGQTGGMAGGQMGSGAQQSGMSHQTTHETVGHRFESEMTNELNQALESFDRVVEIAEWCADKCIEGGPQMADCARLCKDLADLASMNERLIARDSINGPEVAETFLRIAEREFPILQRHQQAPHVQETMQAVEQAIDATNKLLSSIGGGREMDQQSMGAGQQTSQQPISGIQQSTSGGQQPMGSEQSMGAGQQPMGGEQRMGSEQQSMGGGEQMDHQSMTGGRQMDTHSMGGRQTQSY